MKYRAISLAVLLAVLVGCSGGGAPAAVGMQIPAVPQVTSTTKFSSEVNRDANVPAAAEPTNTVLLQLLQSCVLELDSFEAAIRSAMTRSDRHATVIRWSLELYRRVIAVDGRLIGRDMSVRFVGPTDTPDLSGASINVYGATSVTGLPNFNAFALKNTVVMMDDFLNALCESAAYWDRLLEQAGENEDLIDPVELIGGLGRIFLDNSQGNFGLTVAEAEVGFRIDNRTFAFEAYWGSVAYVLFHELGHANLQHSLFKCLIQKGISQALQDAGIVLTPQEQTALDLALIAVSRVVETQSDIYAATIAERAGFSTNGAGIMVLGFLGLNILGGSCDPNDPPAAFESCILDATPEDDHPPLNLRAEIAVAVIDEGKDLTPLLDIVQALGP